MNVFIHVFLHSYTKDLQKLPPYTELHTYTKTSITHPSLYTCCMCYICIQTIHEQIQIKQSSNYGYKPQIINICVFLKYKSTYFSLRGYCLVWSRERTNMGTVCMCGTTWKPYECIVWHGNHMYAGIKRNGPNDCPAGETVQWLREPAENLGSAPSTHAIAHNNL